MRFEVQTAKSYPAEDYDLVCFFDCLHDMGDPVGAMRHVRETMADDGTCMLVEPFAGDRLEDNLNPVGRIFYAASDDDLHAPRRIDQEVRRWRSVRRQARPGFATWPNKVRSWTRFRRAAETAVQSDSWEARV